MSTPRHNSTRLQQRGFTLIELMAVVAILGLLASVATVGYTKYLRVGHKSEIVGNLAQMALRQRANKAVRGHYASATRWWLDGLPRMNQLTAAKGDYVEWQINPGMTYNRHYTGELWPASSARWRGGSKVHGFDVLNFIPEGGKSRCSYNAMSGWGSQSIAVDPAGNPGADAVPNWDFMVQLFPNNTQHLEARDWFMAWALCDYKLNGWSDSKATGYALSSHSMQVIEPDTNRMGPGE